MKERAALKNLISLDLSDTDVTDADMRELTALKKLHQLYLRDTRVADAGLKELKLALPKCRVLK